MALFKVAFVGLALCGTVSTSSQAQSCAGNASQLPVAVLSLEFQSQAINAQKAATIIQGQLKAAVCRASTLWLLPERIAERKDSARTAARLLIAGNLVWHPQQSALLLRAIDAQTGEVFYSVRLPLATDRRSIVELSNGFMDSTLSRLPASLR